MDISQKSFSNKTRFEFGEENLGFTVEDKSGSQSFIVAYGSIPTDVGMIEEKNIWYRNVGLLWSLIGFFIMAQSYLSHGELIGSFWFILGIGCLIVYWVVKTRYTVIDTQKGRLFIINNEQRDIIMEEIDTRRKGQWYSWYGTINFENQPSNEINKYIWLLEKDVISEKEYNESVSQIISYHNLKLTSSESDWSERTMN